MLSFLALKAPAIGKARRPRSHIIVIVVKVAQVDIPGDFILTSDVKELWWGCQTIHGE